ncbi:MAG: FHA domain-containing protein, partial [Blastocatellia bacterium]
EKNTAAATGGAQAAPAAAQPDIRCLLRLKPGPGSRYGEMKAALTSGAAPTRIGRKRDNTIIIDDGTVSSFHAAVALDARGQVVLSDLGSSNGTSVNGVRLSQGDRAVIRAGDRLRFGDIEMIVDITG